MTAKETYRFVEEIVIHPDYVLRTSDNDIALLRFSPPLNYTDYIRPICLADSDSTFNNATEAWATGFGLIGRQGGNRWQTRVCDFRAERVGE